LSAHVFVGPTLAIREVRAAAPTATCHPPVSHGDLLRLDLGPGDTAVIIDGYFHQVPALRHKEILWAMARGARVIGCSSLGALRAVELAPYGMIGSGVVFGMFRDGVIEADDEVAVAHGEGPDYQKFGIPLVSLRHAVAMAQRDGAVSPAEADGVIAAGRSLAYPSRSWRALEATVDDDGQLTDAVRRLRAHLAAHPHHADVKAADAVDTLRRLSELTGRTPARRPEWIDSPMWNNRVLHQWRAEFAGPRIDGVHVSNGAVMRYQQIYRRDFPQRWTAVALCGIRDGTARGPAGSPGPRLEAEALRVAAAQGVDAARLTPEQRAEWLTPQEITDLSPTAMVLRVLVRSYHLPNGAFDLAAAEPDLVADPVAQRAVAESSVVNAEVLEWEPGRGLDYLKAGVLREHLAAIWETTGERSLEAAARDRGLHSLEEAVEAVRPFYLRHRLTASGPARAVGVGN
jgi:hypothetical protein